MGVQIQELKKQRRLLIFVCSVLVLMVLVAGIYAFVQRGIAVQMEKKAIESEKRTMECEKEAIMQRKMAEMARAEALAAREEALRNSQRPKSNRDK